MKYSKTMEEVRALSNEELFAYAKELGHRMSKTVHLTVFYGDNVENFLQRIQGFLTEEKLDSKNVKLYTQSNESMLLSAEKNLDLNSARDRKEIEDWYHAMLEWVERDRKEFERLKARHNW